jgi:hypothetical protein
MTSKYHGLPPERLERLIRDRKSLIKVYLAAARERTLLGRDLGTIFDELRGLEVGLKEMEAALKPTIDYEDGTWV